MVRTFIRKYDNFKLYYWDGATLVGKYKMPQLSPTQLVPSKAISFNERSSIANKSEYWVDFFIDDALFESFWNHPEKSFNNLKQFLGIIGPDYSMLQEMLPAQKIYNCARNRMLDYYLQTNGFNIIPAASWSCQDDFDWCFDGLPKNSSIAISSNGCLSNPYSKEIFLCGVKELQNKLKPSSLIICGRPIKELDTYNNISYYPSFSQRWSKRAKLLKNARGVSYGW